MTEKKQTDRFTLTNVPKDLLIKAKQIALEEDRPLGEVITELLKHWVEDKEQEEKLKR